ELVARVLDLGRRGPVGGLGHELGGRWLVELAGTVVVGQVAEQAGGVEAPARWWGGRRRRGRDAWWRRRALARRRRGWRRGGGRWQGRRRGGAGGESVEAGAEAVVGQEGRARGDGLAGGDQGVAQTIVGLVDRDQDLLGQPGDGQGAMARHAVGVVFEDH